MGHRRGSEGVRGFLGETAFAFGRIGFERSHRHGEHRGFREEVVGVANQVAGPSSNRRVRSAAVARIGVSVAGSCRVAARSQCGCSEPST